MSGWLSRRVTEPHVGHAIHYHVPGVGQPFDMYSDVIPTRDVANAPPRRRGLGRRRRAPGIREGCGGHGAAAGALMAVPYSA